MMIKGVRMYVVHKLCMYFRTGQTLSKRQGDKKARINRAESRQPCFIPSMQGPHQ